MAPPTRPPRPPRSRTAGSSSGPRETAKPRKPPAPSEPPPGASGAPQDVIVVGCSRSAQQQAFPALRRLEAAGIVRIGVVVDADQDSRDLLAGIFPHARPAATFEAAVVSPGALALVASPARFHPLHANAAVKRGWHVLCEAPLAGSARDAAAMIAAAARHERLLAVDLHRRFFPAAHYLRTLCRDHLLGPAFGFEIHEGVPLPAAPAVPVPVKFESPDGVLAELGTPALDLLIWCLGPASIVRYADDAMGGVEANALLELTFSEGVRGTVHLSRDWPTNRSYAFLFERGTVRWTADEANRLTVQLANAPAALDADLLTPIPPETPAHAGPLLPSAEAGFVAQLQNVIAAIGRREALRAPATEAMHSLPLIEECYARRVLLDQPWLTANEAAHARALSAPVGNRPA